MPNGRPGDHPITDLLVHGEHPFPPDIEEMIRRLYEIDPSALNGVMASTYNAKPDESMEGVRSMLKQLLAQRAP